MARARLESRGKCDRCDRITRPGHGGVVAVCALEWRRGGGVNHARILEERGGVLNRYCETCFAVELGKGSPADAPIPMQFPGMEA